jgi:alkylation response protein AidB-like acyl-CoA dehydrogenase
MTIDLALSAEEERAKVEVRRLLEAVAQTNGRSLEELQDPGEQRRHVLSLLQSTGLASLTIPKSVGGQEAPWLRYVLSLEETARAGSSFGLLVHLQNVLGRVLPADLANQVAQGTAIVALADQEPGAWGKPTLGSGGRLLTRLRKGKGSSRLLDGEKALVFGAPIADLLVVSAAGDEGVELVLVPVDSPGVLVEPVPVRGLAVGNCARVTFRGVTVGDDARLGIAPDAIWPQLGGLAVAWEVQSGLEAVHLMVEDCKVKQTFGRPLLKWEAIQFKLSEAQSNLEHLQLMSRYLAWSLDQAVEFTDPGFSIIEYTSLLRTAFAQFGYAAFEACLEIGSGRVFREDSVIWRRYMDYYTLRLMRKGLLADREVLVGAVRRRNAQIIDGDPLKFEGAE